MDSLLIWLEAYYYRSIDLPAAGRVGGGIAGPPAILRRIGPYQPLTWRRRIFAGSQDRVFLDPRLAVGLETMFRNGGISCS